MKNQKIVTVNDIKSNTFKTKKDFNAQYKAVKEEFKRQLGFDVTKHGLITLCMLSETNDIIKITSKTKSDMTEYMDKLKGNEFLLLIKGQNYLVKGF